MCQIVIIFQRVVLDSHFSNTTLHSVFNDMVAFGLFIPTSIGVLIATHRQQSMEVLMDGTKYSIFQLMEVQILVHGLDNIRYSIWRITGKKRK